MKREQKKSARELYLLGEVNAENMGRLFTQIRDLLKEDEKEEIALYITSNGGVVSMAFAFYDLIKFKEVNLTTVGCGQVDSAALIVLLAGRKRLCTEHSLFLIHHVSRQIKGATLEPYDFKINYEDSVKVEKLMVDIIKRNTKMSFAEIEEKVEKSISLTADEAQVLGLVELII